MVTVVADRLGQRGYRLTGPRQQVLGAVLGRESPFTAQEIVDELATRGVGRATVFRTLDLLTRLGVLNRIHADDRLHRYTVCDEGHHDHLVCRACGEVAEATSPRLEAAVRQAAQESNFRPLGHSLEIYGICRSCQGAS